MTQLTQATAAPRRQSARERLLAAAMELFYAEGIHTVGIDRIIEHAGVAKASLYKTFGSKDELIRSYLEQRHASIEAHTLAEVERRDDPREKILAVFDAQGERMREPGYHGCAFVSATAESAPDSPALQATAAYRGWLRALFTELVTAAGADDAHTLAPKLLMIYDGAALAYRLDANAAAADTARRAAGTVMDADLPARP